jgi:hypothetical protein
MGLFDRFRKSAKAPAPLDDKRRDEIIELYHRDDLDPEGIESTHLVLEYLRRIWAGGEHDPTFERRSLSKDLDFDTLNLAEVLYALSKERDIPVDRIAYFVGIGLPGASNQVIATLLKRVATLGEAGWSETQRNRLLRDGAIGDVEEILPIRSEFDRVEFIIKECMAVESIKEWTDHQAPDLEQGQVEEDEGWR